MKKLLIILPTIVITACAILFFDSLTAPLRFTWRSNIAQFHEARGNYGKAIHEYNRAAKIYREDRIMKHLPVVYRKDMNRFAEEAKDAAGPAGSEEKALALVRRSPENPYTHITLANYYLSRTYFRKARESFDRAVALNPNVRRGIALSLGQLEYGERRDIRKAVDYYEQVCGDNPAALARNPMLIKLYFLGGKAEEKKELITNFAERNPRTKRRYLYESLGYAYLALGRYSEASFTFLNALKAGLATTDIMQGQLTADAHMMLMRAGQLAPAQPGIALALIARAMQNDPSLWKEAARITDENDFPPGPAGFPPEFHYVLAKSYGEKGRADSMVREYGVAVEKNPGYFEAVAELEKIYAGLDKPGEAARLRQSAQKYQSSAFTWRQFIGANRGNLYANGSAIIRDVRLLSGRVVISVQARGSRAAGAFPLMALFLDGRYIGTAAVEKKMKWYSFETDVATGRHLLDIRFPNDLRLGGEDRNLYINAVRIGRK